MSTDQDQNRYAPPTARVDDIPTDGPQLAGRGTRFGAALIDGLIQGGIYYVLAYSLFRSLIPDGQSGNIVSAIAMQFVVSVLILVLLQGYLLVTRGQTIAKKLLGIRIVRSDGSAADAGRVLGLRYVLIYVIAVIPVIGWIFALVDVLMIFRDSHKCLHDNIADTIVVKV